MYVMYMYTYIKNIHDIYTHDICIYTIDNPFSLLLFTYYIYQVSSSSSLVSLADGYAYDLEENGGVCVVSSDMLHFQVFTLLCI